jgi:hypothetical protein
MSMKKYNRVKRFLIRSLLAFILFGIVITAVGQPPERIHFQITVRDYYKNLISDQDIAVRIRLINMDADVLYEEKQHLRTSSTGIASINIGDGYDQKGDLNSIGEYVSFDKLYIRTDIDPAGGTDYSIVNHNPISSMPYALNAAYVLQPEETDTVFAQSVASKIDNMLINRWDRAARIRHYPGDVAGGGVVFFVDSTGENGMVASMVDVAEEVSWALSPAEINGAESFHNGEENTRSIVDNSGPSAEAAYFCDTLTMGKKDDWYLPSIDELGLLFDSRYQVNKAAGEDQDTELQGLNPGRYWSSTESGAEEAWILELGKIAKENKSEKANVRAIRKFSGMYDVHNYPWLVLLGPEEELKSDGNVSVILEDENGDVLVDEAGKRGTVCRTTPEIALPVKITFKLQTEYNPNASEPPTILRGTGDFRICFGGPPKGETLENLQESNMGEYEGVQFRIHPHLDESPIRVYTGSESHTCTSIWLRYVDPGKLVDDYGNPITGLASDECQSRGNQCGWERVGLFEDGFGLENREEALVTIIISEEIISISVKKRTWSVNIDDLMANDNDIVGDALRFDTVTFMSISHTNTSRGYSTIKISDLRVLPLE